MQHPLLNIAIQAARNASKILLRFIDHIDSIKVDTKNRNDFVTEVDRLAEQEIINVIRKAYPNHGILAEESGRLEGNDYCWIIDPLDGTTNYIHGFPQYAISIAAKLRDKTEVGVIYDPIRHEMFTAARGAGAQLNNQRLRVSSRVTLENALIGTGFPFHETSQLERCMALFRAIFPKAEGRHAGSAALNLAYVASGRLDGYWEALLQEWDYAAGLLLVQEAGGLIGDFHGKPDYLDTGDIVAANPKIFKLLVECIEEALLPSRATMTQE